MIINNIRIQNFRGFQDKYFEFDPNMNVVLGDNTTGKTTLLHAVQIALGAFFKALDTLPRAGEFSRNFKKTDIPLLMSENNKSLVKGSDKPSITTTAICQNFIFSYDDNLLHKNNDFRIEWTREFNVRSYIGLIRDYAVPLEYERRNADKTNTNSLFPLFLAFGSNRLERYNYLRPQKSKRFEVRLENAYKNALDDKRGIGFVSASNWIYKYEFSVIKGLEFEHTDKAFINAITNAIPAIREIKVDTRNGEFSAEIQMSKDPEPYWLTYDIMSDGFKSMINIVSDIAYRCIMLNGFLGKDAVKETPGVVMIDEVDLFLHPHWQQHVLADLQTAFPKIQFIVTTHSPFIVQSVESKNVITLDGNISPLSPSQRGVEEISACEMGMEGMLRSEVYRKKQQLALKYFELVKAGKNGEIETEKVRKELNNLELEASLFHDPAYESFLKLNRGKL